MPIGYCDPNGTNTGEWHYTGSATHHENVNDGDRQPDVPDFDDNNHFEDGDESDLEDYDFTTLTVDAVSSVKIWVYYTNVYGHDPECRIYMGGWTAQQTFNNTGQWTSLTFNGAWDQADLNGLRVELQAPATIDKFEVGIIWECYAEVTYEGEEGYGHDFMGVPSDNIDSVNGVPNANIDKIKGV